MATLNVGEICLWYRHPTDNDPIPAVVVKTTSNGILEVMLFRRQAKELDFRRGVHWKYDPILKERPDVGTDQRNNLGGVWEVVQRYVSPAQENLLSDAKQLERRSSELLRRLKESEARVFAPEKAADEQPEEKTVEDKIAEAMKHFDVDPKIEAMMAEHLSVVEIAAKLTELTGVKWTYQRAYQATMRLKRKAAQTAPELSEIAN